MIRSKKRTYRSTFLQQLFDIVNKIPKKNFIGKRFSDSVKSSDCKVDDQAIDFLNKDVKSINDFRLIFKTQSNDWSANSRIVRSRLTERLTRILFSVDIDSLDASLLVKKRLKCLLLYTGGKILQRLHSAQPAIELFRTAFKSAEKYEFSEIASDCAAQLIAELGFLGKIEECRFFYERFQYWKKAHYHETTLSFRQISITSMYKGSWALKQENIVRLKAYIKEAREFLHSTPLNSLKRKLYDLSILLGEVSQDYKLIVSTTELVLKEHDLNPLFFPNGYVGACLSSALSVHIWRTEFEEAKVLCHKIDGLISPLSANRPFFNQMHVILYMRMNDYEQAARTFSDAISSGAFDLNDKATVQTWRLLEFYIRFGLRNTMPFAMNSLINLDAKKPIKWNFRSWTTEYTKNLAKDSGGFQPPAIIAHALYLISIDDKPGLIIRNEALQAFRRSKLDLGKYRVAMMIRLIHCIVDCQFNYDLTVKKSAIFRRRLSNVPEKYQGGSSELLEIIPFEEVWEMMLEYLKLYSVDLPPPVIPEPKSEVESPSKEIESTIALTDTEPEGAIVDPA